MGSLKSMLVLAALGGAGYFTYISLNQMPAPEPPPDAPDQWVAPTTDLGQPVTGSEVATIAAAPTASPAFPPAQDHLSPAPAFVPPAGQPSIGTNLPKETTAGSAYPAMPPASSSLAPAPPASIPNDSLATSEPDRRLQVENPWVRGTPDSGAAAADQPNGEFADSLAKALALLRDGKLAEAHLLLSNWYHDTRLSAKQRGELEALLDQLAGTVVYSRQHLLTQPYEVQPGDRLAEVAKQYHLEPTLLAKINGVDDPDRLFPGEQLKVFQGPFHGVVDLQRRQLTMLIPDPATGKSRYAGRFAVELPQNMQLVEGECQVQQRLRNPDALMLTNGMRIYGSGEAGSYAQPLPQPGFRVGYADISDVCDMLSVGSRVTIRR